MGVERLRGGCIDQRHGALDEAELLEDRVLRMSEHVDDGIPDADDIEARAVGCCRSHSRLPRDLRMLADLQAARSIVRQKPPASPGFYAPSTRRHLPSLPPMPTDIARAAAQLTDPRIRGVLAKSLAGTLIIFVLLWVGIGYLLAHLVLSQAWLHWIIEILGGLATLVLSWLLFPDSVAEAVEARHYPGLPAARPQPLAELLREGLRFAGVSILLNLVALPVYLLIPAVNLFVFYGLNGYLLSREYFELVAVRRLAPSEARRLRRTYPGQILLMGVLIAFLLTVPVVNLIAPVFATALMVHVYHRLAGTPRGRRAP